MRELWARLPRRGLPLALPLLWGTALLLRGRAAELGTPGPYARFLTWVSDGAWPASEAFHDEIYEAIWEFCYGPAEGDLTGLGDL